MTGDTNLCTILVTTQLQLHQPQYDSPKCKAKILKSMILLESTKHNSSMAMMLHCRSQNHNQLTTHHHTFVKMSFGIPGNCLMGVWTAHILLCTILHKFKAFPATAAQPRFRAISNKHLINRPALWVTYTISDMRANPSNFRFDMYACRRTLILADGSSMDSLMGNGTRSTSFDNSTFSSSLTTMCLKK